ncbi:MAG: hypothetical protein KIC92_08915 [Clostridiales bacterium]|nr:hypothetical protein [Clostridiales bacterium]
MKISDFLINNNVGNVLEKEVIVSDRFVDEGGNHIPFKIRNISPEELADIERRTNNSVERFIGYIEQGCIEPNFKNIELQNHYGVKNGGLLINKVLLAGEIDILATEILKLSGFFKTFDELVQDAKKQ